MQDAASELPRIYVPRTWVNKYKHKGPGSRAVQPSREANLSPKYAWYSSRPPSLPSAHSTLQPRVAAPSNLSQVGGPLGVALRNQARLSLGGLLVAVGTVC